MENLFEQVEEILEFQNKKDFKNYLQNILQVVSKYQNPCLLYQGPQTKIFWAIDTDHQVVLKFVSNLQEAQNELNALEDLNGRYHIVKLYDYREFKELDLSLFVLEYQPPVRFSPKTLTQLASYTFQILEALYCIHANCITHSDLKPDNIIVDSQQIVTLIDFGLAVDGITYSKACGIIGTIPYIAPEVLEEKPIKQPADIWSLGVILSEILLQQPLFKLSSAEALLGQQKLFNFSQFDQKAKEFDSNDDRTVEFWEMVKSMLQLDPKKRITADQAQEYLCKLFEASIVCSLKHY